MHLMRLIKKELEGETLNPIDEAVPFVLECDASESKIPATLNQTERPIEFMSITLLGRELQLSSKLSKSGHILITP